MTDIEFIRNIVQSELIDGTTSMVLGRVTIIAEYIAGIFFIIAVGWNIITSTIKKLQNKNSPGFVNFQDLIRILTIMLLIGIYPIISNFLVSGIDHINSMTAPTTEMSKQMEQMVKDRNENKNYDDIKMKIEAAEALLASGKGSPEKRAALEDILQKARAALEQKESQGVIMDDDTSWKSTMIKVSNIAAKPSIGINYIIGGILRILANLIRGLVMMFAVVLFKILIIVGPLALAFSIIPSFRDKLEQWFQALLTVGFAFTTIHILDHLYYDMMATMWDEILSGTGEGTASDFDIMGKIIFDLGLLIAYSMTFWITSKFVGSSEAGRFISKGIGLTAMAVGSVVSSIGLSGGGAAAKGGTKAVKDAISVGSKALNDNE